MIKNKIYTISTCKGGVGKSTLLIHLAEVLTNQPRNRGVDNDRNMRVLIVDTDAQANTTHYFGKTKGTLYDSLVNDEPLVVEHTDNPLIDIVTADIRLANADYALSLRDGGMGRERLLADKLAELRMVYDIILIDTAPNLGVLTLNGIYCADKLIIPCVAEPFSVEGLQLTLTIKQRIDRLKQAPMDFNIVITRRKNTVLQKQEEEVIRDAYKDKVVKDVMHEKAVYAENSLGQSHQKMLNSEMRYLPFSLGIY